MKSLDGKRDTIQFSQHIYPSCLSKRKGYYKKSVPSTASILIYNGPEGTVLFQLVTGERRKVSNINHAVTCGVFPAAVKI
jgi:hypothetical protein